jgi:heme/copper-type cytochrome/quinol oxidase subunit 2
MRRLPLLLIALFLLTLAGGMTYLWVSYATASLQQQQAFSHNLTQTAFPLALIAFPLLAVLGFIIWIWALVHMLTNTQLQGTDKIVWAIVIVFLNVLGAILYFVLSPGLRLNAQEQVRKQAGTDHS